MDIEFGRSKYLKSHNDYLHYMENNREIDELLDAKMSGKLCYSYRRLG